MDMHQKRKMRKEKREANLENNKEFTTSHISWYERIYVPCGKKLVFIRN